MSEGDGPSSSGKKEGGDQLIRDVWAYNLDEELEVIRRLVLTYKHVAMDTEFPGVVARPVGVFKTGGEYQYHSLRLNCDMLKIIRLGVTFADDAGNLPEPCHTWQFNFSFRLDEDIHAPESIELLRNSGIDFDRFARDGIDLLRFGEMLTTSGLVCNEGVKWVSFHSGYDFGYLLRVLTNSPLPESEREFFDVLGLFFPCIYDIKYIVRNEDSLRGGLSKVADSLGVQRIGPMHQAGSDALLTLNTFFAVRRQLFNGELNDDKCMGVLYGLGNDKGGNYVPQLAGGGFGSQASFGHGYGSSGNFGVST